MHFFSLAKYCHVISNMIPCYRVEDDFMKKNILLLLILLIPITIKAYDQYSLADYAYFDPISNATCDETNYWTPFYQDTTCYRFITLEDNDTSAQATLKVMLDHNVGFDTYQNYANILKQVQESWVNYQGTLDLIDEDTIVKFMKLNTKPEISSENPSAISVNNNGLVYPRFMLNSYYYNNQTLINYYGFWSKDLYPSNQNYAYTITEYGNNRLVALTEKRGIRPALTVRKQQLTKSSSSQDFTSQITKKYSYQYSSTKYDNFTYKQLQGFTKTKDKLVFYSSNNANPEKGLVISYTGSDYHTLYKISYDNTGHGNDMTYNSKTNEVLLVGPNNYKEIFVYNADTMEHTKTYSENVTGYSAIAYDKYNDLYFGYSGQRIYALDNSFNRLYSFDASFLETTQGMEYHNGYIYMTTYEGGCSSSYQLWCLNTTSSALVYVYNAKLNTDKTPSSSFGHLEKIIYLGPKIGELESISFDDAEAIFGYATQYYDANNTYQFYTTSLNNLANKPSYTIKYLIEENSAKISILSNEELALAEGFTAVSKAIMEKEIKSTDSNFSVKICDNYNNCSTEKINVSQLFNTSQDNQNNMQDPKPNPSPENPQTGAFVSLAVIIIGGIFSLIGLFGIKNKFKI